MTSHRLIYVSTSSHPDGTISVYIRREDQYQSSRYHSVGYASLLRLVNLLQHYIDVAAMEVVIRPSGWSVYPVRDISQQEVSCQDN